MPVRGQDFFFGKGFHNQPVWILSTWRAGRASYVSNDGKLLQDHSCQEGDLPIGPKHLVLSMSVCLSVHYMDFQCQPVWILSTWRAGRASYVSNDGDLLQNHSCQEGEMISTIRLAPTTRC